MIIVVIIFSLIYVILLTLILIAYYRDNGDLERRVLELEKKVNGKIFNEISDEELDLLKKYDNEYRNWVFNPIEHGLNIFGENFSNPKKLENNTQKECECDMACGRKGRPRGSKNIHKGGGRRK